MEDLSGRQDDDAEDDLAESPRVGGQAVPVSFFVIDPELLD